MCLKTINETFDVNCMIEMKIQTKCCLHHQIKSSFSFLVDSETIDSEGNASGIGAQGDIEISAGEWNINNEGEVTGSNVITIRSSGMITVQWSSWSLQLNQDMDVLTGEFSCNALGTMDVNLSKQ